LSDNQEAADVAAPAEPAKHRRRRWVALAAAVALVAGACGTVVVVTRNDESSKAVAVDSPLMETTTTRDATTTTASTTTTTVPAPVAVPAAPPKDPYEKVPIVQIGAIYIPKIGLQHALYEGVSLTVIDHGPGHWPGSAMPGQVGNTVFPGHRVTHSHPFLDLDKLVPGDQIVFQMPEADYVYEMRTQSIVVPTDMWVVDPTPTATVTLIACHPKHSARQRIVIKGDLVATMPK
jgi:sortase A